MYEHAYIMYTLSHALGNQVLPYTLRAVQEWVKKRKENLASNIGMCQVEKSKGF